jgi:capsular polysaccharide biosynthesis protein
LTSVKNRLLGIRGFLGSIRRSRATRSVLEPIYCLRRRVRQRLGGRHVVGFWKTTRAYLADARLPQASASYQVIDPPVAETIPAAVFIGGRSHGKMGPRTTLSPETFVARIPDALVVGHKGAVLASDRRLLWDLSYDWPGLPHLHYLYDWRPGEGAIEELEGATATLATMGSEVNYYHFLLNALPRVDVLRRSGRLAEADRILVSGAVTPWLSEVMAMVGVPVDRLIGTAQHPIIRCRTLIAPSLILDPFIIPQRAVRWLRDEILPHVPWDGKARRLFVDRSDASSRRVNNLDELRPILDRFGVEVVRLGGWSLLDQARLFQQAELVITSHGAALTNIIFCRPGARVVQLMPDDMQEHNFRPLATYCGLHMLYLICPVAPGCEHVHIKDKDLLLQPADLARLLESDSAGPRRQAP